MKEQLPVDLFDRPYTAKETCSCLQRFVMEARKEDGSQYPPKILYLMLAAFLRHSREVQSDPVNFLDWKDVCFKKLHGTCDVVFCSLHENGIGVGKKTTPVIQKEDEKKLLDSNVFNTTTPEGLQRAVFYYVGKLCCLRGGEEQCNLKPSQFKRNTNPDRYIYSEHGQRTEMVSLYTPYWEQKCWNI